MTSIMAKTVQVQSSASTDKSHRLLVTAVRTSVAPNHPMASRLDMLEKNFDKLEKFFSKRRKAAAFRDSLFGGSRSVTPAYPQAPLDRDHVEMSTQIFPHAPFIRPTSTRMRARDEVTLASHPVRRAQSLPETSNPPSQFPTRSPAETITSSLEVPTRSSSLLYKPARPSIAGLLEFSFAEKPRRSHDSSLPSIPASPLQGPVKGANLNNPQGLLSVFPSHRPDTPPHSDQESSSPPSPVYMKTLHAVPPRSGPTPEPESSPALLPLLADRNSNCTVEQRVPRQRHVSLGNSEASQAEVMPLRKALSDSTLATPTPSPSRDSVLKEPSLDEFLSLSDDDIADECTPTVPPSTPPSCSLPAKPTPTPESGQASKRYPLLTLASPLTSRPATAAAFEAARLAARYKFDLVYVVNLWPKESIEAQHMASIPTRAPGLSHTDDYMDGHGPLACISPKSGMTGRLLAGYGLPSVMSPFRISAPVHRKVLRTDGWLEYRSETTTPDEFSRGYSCSFYTGVGLKGTTFSESTPSQSPKRKSKKKRSRPKNRGIVFAAYRLPRLDGTTISSDPSELEALYGDAEALVEMLIDIHSMQRARRPMARHHVDETGPMPTRSGIPSLAT